MSEHYEFPDEGEIPTIKTTTDEQFEFPERKTIFITYNSDEWESKEDAVKVVERINCLFGREVQIAIVPKDFDLLAEGEVADLLEEVTDGDD